MAKTVVDQATDDENAKNGGNPNAVGAVAQAVSDETADRFERDKQVGYTGMGQDWQNYEAVQY